MLVVLEMSKLFLCTYTARTQANSLDFSDIQTERGEKANILAVTTWGYTILQLSLLSLILIKISGVSSYIGRFSVELLYSNEDISVLRTLGCPK